MTGRPVPGNRNPSRNALSTQTPCALERTLCELSRLPPLVTSWEVETLKSQLAEAARGERFLLQGGDCSREFRRLPLGRHRQQAQDPAEDEHRAGLRLAQAA